MLHKMSVCLIPRILLEIQVRPPHLLEGNLHHWLFKSSLRNSLTLQLQMPEWIDSSVGAHPFLVLVLLLLLHRHHSKQTIRKWIHSPFKIDTYVCSLGIITYIITIMFTCRNISPTYTWILSKQNFLKLPFTLTTCSTLFSVLFHLISS